ncbi:hypothetical protein FQ154_19880 [Paeniglutamicibacter gangotriensis]|uniref:Uncharacterized protein n=1 Tax=Paeniglutamicibacter gangotriensis TaxID=254787 RepID=A0A5B0E268_9MICC|nr:hypothetical protein [Paeniglutamicibacter gangotriensis]KAA0973114.1 hypothetical protein FQ154_19880 [Paeniglutamicibacter gangotriensis]
MSNDNATDDELPLIICSLIGFIGLGAFSLVSFFTPIRTWLVENKILITANESVVAIEQWNIGLDMPRLVLVGAFLVGVVALTVLAGTKRKDKKL